MASITVRIRSQLGIWRLENINVTQFISELRQILEKEHKTEIISPFSLSPRYVDKCQFFVLFFLIMYIVI